MTPTDTRLSLDLDDLPADPSPGESWPLYPIHRPAVLDSESSRSGSYRQRRMHHPCCGHHDRREVTTDVVGDVTCAGREATTEAHFWQKRLRYYDAGYRWDPVARTFVPFTDSPRSDAA